MEIFENIEIEYILKTSFWEKNSWLYYMLNIHAI